jgi:hemolysin activation/secretion protein
VDCEFIAELTSGGYAQIFVFPPVARPMKGAVGVSILTALFAGHATAQTVAPSQVTPQTLRPSPSGPGGVGIPAAAALTTPPGAEKLFVTLRQVVIEGGFEELAAANEAFVGSIKGQRVSVAAIYDSARALEAAYASAGYVLVRVVLPPQQLKDAGTIRLIIVDGFIETIDVSPLPERVRALVIARMRDLIGKRHIKIGEIERRLLIAGDLPGLRLRSTLARGDQQGGTKLILDGVQHVVTGSIGVDNRLPNTLGTWSFNGGVALNSVFGFGEQIYGSMVGPGDVEHTFDTLAPIRVVGAGAVIPLGNDGWIINPEYTLSRTRPLPQPNVPDTVGVFERWAMRTSYPVIRERAGSLALEGSFEAITQYNTAIDFNTDLDRDRYEVTRAGADGGFLLPWGASVHADAIVSHGIGGRDQTDAENTGVPLSRLGAEPVFTKINGDVQFVQALPEAFTLTTIARGQSSLGDPLLLSEQFSLDAPNGISSFPEGTFTVDQGWTVRGEFSRAFSWRYEAIDANVAPYVFAATGKGYLVMPTAVETASVTASAFGVGVRTGFNELLGFSGLTASIEYGKQYSDEPGLPVGYRTMATISERF